MEFREGSGCDRIAVPSSAHNREGGDRQRIIIGPNLSQSGGTGAWPEVENRRMSKPVNSEFFFEWGADNSVPKPDAELVLHRGMINKLILTPMWNVRSGNRLVDRNMKESAHRKHLLALKRARGMVDHSSPKL